MRSAVAPAGLLARRARVLVRAGVLACAALAWPSVAAAFDGAPLRAEGGPDAMLRSASVAPALAPGFGEQTVWSGLSEPTTLRFAPDGRVFVAEKSGRILVYPSLTSTTPTLFADLTREVDTYWDRGLLGLALDPAFDRGRPYVYVLYTYDKEPGSAAVPRWNDGCPTPPGPTTGGCVVSGRLARLDATAPDPAAGELPLITDWCQQFPSHSIGSLEFGPDGALYASAGDGASFAVADYGQFGSPLNPCGDPPAGVGGAQTIPTAEGGMLRTQSFRRPAGQPASLDGTIVRVDPDTGAALPDDPDASDGDPNRARTVAYGLRNPFRFTLRPGTNEIWAGDVGWAAWEEIDRVPDPLAGVTNFGWPCFEGPGDSDLAALGLDACTSLYSQPGGGVAAPFYAYSHETQVVAGEACPVGSSSITGIVFGDDTAFPAPYDKALFFADYARGCVWAMLPGPGGLPDPSNVRTLDAGAAGPVDLRVGPDGALYYADLRGGTIRRIAYTANAAPVARISATPTSGPTPLTVGFDGSASSDPEGDPLSYSWDLDGDGNFGDSTAPNPTYTYTAPGPYTVRLRVTDPTGARDTTSVAVAAGTPPTATIAAPTPTASWSVGDTIAFSGSAVDGTGAPLPASALSWSLDLHHCSAIDPASCHVHHVEDFAGVASGSFVAPDHDYPSHLSLSLTATDTDGLRDTSSVRLDPRTVDLTLASVPSGAQVTADSTTATAPFTHRVIEGSTNSLAVPAGVLLGGSPFTFASWSDGGARVHTIVAPATPTTYTATFAPVPPRLRLSSSALAFAAIQDGAAPAQTLQVSTDTGARVPFTVTGGASWLSVTPRAGAAPADVTVAVDIAGLGAGAHSATIAIDAGAAGRATIPISLRLAPASTGLLGAWAFDEPRGAAVRDASGRRNAGTLWSVRRTAAGRFGRALSFDRSGGWVTVPDSPSLHPTRALTVEGWAYPTARTTGWTALAVKETARGSAWGLYGADPAGFPRAAARTTFDGTTAGAVRLPLRRWTHLAETYDGIAVRLYVDGSLAGSRPQTGPLATSRFPLRFGGDSVWPAWFTGRLDEIRVYDRPLTGSQIRADMRRPIR